MMTAIHASRLGKRYDLGSRRQQPFWAIRDVSFEVPQGQVVGIVGRNGAGKSTLLRILSRVSWPTEGEVTLHGRVGTLLEVGTGFHPDLTGRENVFLNGAMLGMRRQDVKARFDDIVRFAQVDAFLDEPIKHYSSGMSMRLAFSVAAHMDSDILIVDEALAVGDAVFQRKCMQRMHEEARSGRTILFVSHNLGAVRRLCDRALLMDRGSLIADGSPADILGRYELAESNGQQHMIPARAHWESSGQATLQSVTPMDVTGTPRSKFLIGDTIGLEFAYDVVDERLDGASFWVVIWSDDDVPVASAVQRDSSTMTLIRGRNQMRVHFPDCNLLPGTYTVGVGILGNEGQHVDWVDRCPGFTVVDRFQDGREFDGRLGIMRHAAVWDGNP